MEYNKNIIALENIQI